MRLSALLNAKVHTESGEGLGRVFDVRAEQVGGRWRVTGLVVGRRGFLERLGFVRSRGVAKRHHRRRPHDAVPWDAVVRADRRGIVVRDGTELE